MSKSWFFVFLVQRWAFKSGHRAKNKQECEAQIFSSTRDDYVWFDEAREHHKYFSKAISPSSTLKPQSTNGVKRSAKTSSELQLL